MTAAETASKLWSAQTLPDRNADHLNHHPGNKTQEPMLVSSTRGGRTIDRVLDTMSSGGPWAKMARKARQRRSQKAWNQLQKRLIMEAKAQRAAYKERLAAEEMTKKKKEEEEASVEGVVESLVSDAIRAGRKMPVQDSSAAPSQQKED